MTHDLFARTRTGDPNALEELFRRHSDAVYSVALRLTGSTADAEDVLQDVFAGLSATLARAEAPSNPGAWMRTVAVRRAIDLIRSQKRRRTEPLEGVHGRSDSPEPGRIDSMMLERAIAALPASLRSILVLKEIEGFSHAEIAEMLGIGVNASEVRLHRAKQRLRRDLTHD